METQLTGPQRQVGAEQGLPFDPGHQHGGRAGEAQQAGGVEMVPVAVGDGDHVGYAQFTQLQRLVAGGVRRGVGKQQRVDHKGGGRGADQHGVVADEDHRSIGAATSAVTGMRQRSSPASSSCSVSMRSDELASSGRSAARPAGAKALVIERVDQIVGVRPQVLGQLGPHDTVDVRAGEREQTGPVEAGVGVEHLGPDPPPVGVVGGHRRERGVFGQGGQQRRSGPGMR